MRKNVILGVGISAIFAVTSCAQTKESAEVSKRANSTVISETEEVENAISEANIIKSLKTLSADELEGRPTGSKGIEKAADFIIGEFKTAGINPFFETFKDTFEIEGIPGYNIVGFKEGSDPALRDEVIIIGAHYDHIGFGKKVNNDSIANGANDNASGTTAVLELAKFFSERDTKRSLLFALFSAEEMGLIGSKKLAERLKAEELSPYFMFNIEMIGVPMKNKDYLAYLTGFEKSNLPEVFNNISGEKVLGFLPDAEKFNLYKRSDNYAFFKEFGIPAHTVSTFDFTNYDYYHHVDDEFEAMDTAFMKSLIEAFIPGLEGIANSPEKQIEMK